MKLRLPLALRTSLYCTFASLLFATIAPTHADTKEYDTLSGSTAISADTKITGTNTTLPLSGDATFSWGQKSYLTFETPVDCGDYRLTLQSSGGYHGTVKMPLAAEGETLDMGIQNGYLILSGNGTDGYTVEETGENLFLTVTGGQISLKENTLNQLKIETGANVTALGELTVNSLTNNGALNAAGQTVTITNKGDSGVAITTEKLVIKKGHNLSNNITANETTFGGILTLSGNADFDLGTVTGASGTLKLIHSADASVNGLSSASLHIGSNSTLKSTGDVTVSSLGGVTVNSVTGYGTLDATGQTVTITTGGSSGVAITTEKLVIMKGHNLSNNITANETTFGGILTLSGNADFDLGTVTGASGTLKLMNSANASVNGLSSASLHIGSNSTLKSTGDVTVSSLGGVTANSVTGYGTLDAAGQTVTITNKGASGVAITTEKLVIEMGHTLSNNITANGTTFGGTLTLSGNADFQLGTVTGTSTAELVLTSSAKAEVSGLEAYKLKVDSGSALASTGEVSVDKLVGNGTLNAAGHSVSVTGSGSSGVSISAGCLNVNVLTLTNTQDGAYVFDKTSISQSLTLQGTTNAQLGAVEGKDLNISNATGTKAGHVAVEKLKVGESESDSSAFEVSSAEVGELALARSASLTATTGNIEAGSGSIRGILKAENGDITLTSSEISGTVEAAGALTMEGGTTSAGASLKASAYKNTAETTLRSTEVDFSSTEVGSKLTLNNVSGSLGDTTIKGRGRELIINNNSVKAKLGISEGGLFTMSDAHVDGSISLTGAGSKLSMQAASLTGTVEATGGTEIIISGGTSTVGALAAEGTRVIICSAAEQGGDMLTSATASVCSNTRFAIRNVAGGISTLSGGATLLLAENITGFDAEIDHEFDTLNMYLTEENGNSYAVTSINHQGADKTAAQQGVSDAISAAEQENAGGRLGELVEAMGHTDSINNALRALDSVGNASLATTMAAQAGASHDHMRTLRNSISSPGALAVTNDGNGSLLHRKTTKLWSMVTGASSRLSSDSVGNAGYTRHEAGILIGSDAAVTRKLLAGLSAGYSRANVDATGLTTRGDQYFLDVYGRLEAGRFSHSATLGAGISDWSMERSVYVNTATPFRDFSGVGKGQTRGMALNFSYEAACNIRMKERHTLSPLIMVESSLNSLDNFRESGSLGNAGLDVSYDDMWTTTLGLGARYAYSFAGFGNSDSTGFVAMRALIIGELGDTNSTANATFIGGHTPFGLKSAKAGRLGVLIGMDALAPIRRNWALFGNVSVEAKEDYTDIAAGIGVKFSF